ncbi:MAG: carbohydrate ABC transporter permease [Lachnospiraceae bacterium]
MKPSLGYKIFRVVALGMFLIIALFPIYWMVNTSLKPLEDATSIPIQYWPQNFTLDNYKDVLRLTNFPIFFGNSLIVSIISASLTVILGMFAAYGIARFKFKGKNVAMLTLLITQMVPALVLIVPLFIGFSNIGIIDTKLSLIIPYFIMAIPFCTLMMVGFFKQVPYVLEESAMLDGCSRIKSLFLIVIPVILPGLISSFVFAFISAWNELFFGVMFINSESSKTIPPGISMFIQKVDVNWANMTAAATLSMIPVMIMFFFVQKYLVQGIADGAVKG